MAKRRNMNHFIAAHRREKGERTYKVASRVAALKSTNPQKWQEFLEEAGGKRTFLRWREYMDQKDEARFDRRSRSGAYEMRKNPRKISLEAAKALMQGREYKKDNTVVTQISDDDFQLFLHGSAIAAYDTMNGALAITDAGYPTSTTKERLNALPGVRVHTSKGQLHLNGKKWDGDWIEVR